MADEPASLFPDMDFSDIEDIGNIEGIPSEKKWTYVIDFEKRCLVLEDDGRPRKTKTYKEYVIQTAMRILNTERFQYVIFDEAIGVEKSEWPAWEDIEIKRDAEEALEAHSEIEKAEVLHMERIENKLRMGIRIVGVSATVEVEVKWPNEAG
ncbi:DUF2634 domain-containing protein [Aneurinibacillus aneurinilyticus]|uniref:Uncharacterized protein n=1 Tax=Aneurinibacillus aneurinilyticus ATCC 12856 TaxID=649747 RepID=U1WRL1_ANEAE|nr:DUF2634 domain-containing protein [Aneurinibacillus aneurinilyticus]ERI04908.1 hypothetical protein HMPREF0083_05875 [Aneurinibacillus aneurinilyticus ATCC 12856]MED0708194.1 DUF2634 domain-containing protein [Aneurinibacillus aneurinilyticus]MED0721453.1 DUF2634 domain-containing protein [Aneurinibacillus aneurinilyticus]MED0734079.1 DUF2634 domain-containing protein [Aneurinibacillus aneurinilyticus]MED0743206.1 DUF2634 domain-containing protein [Aneurinibacillus aneurinilyticus]